jgi:hypothetical protein
MSRSTTTAAADRNPPARRTVARVPKAIITEAARRAVYDGQERLGEYQQVGPNEYLALDRLGRRIGIYDTAIEATNAIAKAASR